MEKLPAVVRNNQKNNQQQRLKEIVWVFENITILGICGSNWGSKWGPKLGLKWLKNIILVEVFRNFGKTGRKWSTLKPFHIFLKDIVSVHLENLSFLVLS